MRRTITSCQTSCMSCGTSCCTSNTSVDSVKSLPSGTIESSEVENSVTGYVDCPMLHLKHTGSFLSVFYRQENINQYVGGDIQISQWTNGQVERQIYPRVWMGKWMRQRKTVLNSPLYACDMTLLPTKHKQQWHCKDDSFRA